jgi:hypothetical protein
MLDPFSKRPLRLTCLAVASILLALSCSDDEPAPAPVTTPDAGPACETGTSGCACDLVTGCELGLLCIARVCLPTEGGQGGVPNDSDVPDLPGYGGDGPSVEDDAGSTPEPSDAAVADAAPDTGAPPIAPDGGDAG